MQYIERAKEVFLEENPAIQEKLDSLTQHEAEVLGIPLGDYKENELSYAISKFAQANDIELTELFIQLGIEDKHEQQKERIAQARKVAEVLGVEWSEYVQMNPHLQNKI